MFGDKHHQPSPPVEVLDPTSQNLLSSILGELKEQQSFKTAQKPELVVINTAGYQFSAQGFRRSVLYAQAAGALTVTVAGFSYTQSVQVGPNQVDFPDLSLITSSTTITGYLIRENHPRYTNKTNIFVNVKDYGAIGNGVVDDTAATQKAINATPNGGILYFPPGIYLISAQLNVGNTNSITMIGAKIGTTIQTNTAGIDLLHVGYPNTTDPNTNNSKTTYVTIQDIEFNGNNKANNAIFLNRTGNTVLNGVICVNCVNDGVYGQWAENSVARDCIFSASKNGVELTESLGSSSARSNQWVFDSCQFHNNTNGLTLTQTQGTTFDSCIWIDNVSYSVYGTGVTNVLFDQCWFEEISAVTMIDHVYLTGLGGHITFDTCQFYGNLPSDAWINANTVNNGFVTNCFFISSSVGLKITAMNANPYSKGWICEGNEGLTVNDPGYTTVIRGNPRIANGAYTVVQGTSYQNAYNASVTVVLPCWATASGTAGTASASISPDNTTWTGLWSDFVSGSTSPSSQQVLRFPVPTGWYFKLTGTGVSNGNAVIIVEQ